MDLYLLNLEKRVSVLEAKLAEIESAKQTALRRKDETMEKRLKIKYDRQRKKHQRTAGEDEREFPVYEEWRRNRIKPKSH